MCNFQTNYLQSYKFFETRRHEIRQIFQFSSAVCANVDAYARELFALVFCLIFFNLLFFICFLILEMTFFWKFSKSDFSTFQILFIFFLKRFSFSKYFPNFSLFQCRSFPQILCAYTNWRFCQIWLWKQKGVHGRSNSIRPQNSKGSVKLEKKFLIFYFSVEEIFCHFVGAPGSWQGISHGFEYQKRGWKFLK